MTHKLHRRHLLASAAALTLALPAAAARAQPHGLVPDSPHDQTETLQALLDEAATTGQPLSLPPGDIRVAALRLPANLVLEGVPGRTTIITSAGLAITDATALVLRDLTLATGAAPAALLAVTNSDAITLERCVFRAAPAIALSVQDAAATIRECRFDAAGDAAIHAMDSRGLLITGNRIDGCGNAGIRIWRSAPGPDHSIITNNAIAKIDWRGGGNGQNGNGINIFRADGVIIAGNQLSDCAFSAIRLNTTGNTLVSGNTCLRSGEVAIFSEFAFSGSIIANNLVDGAAQGISMTNLDHGGQLAVCTGNIVRNIAPFSAVNPDTTPIGIAAEAEAAITGNSLHAIPGIGILAGYGPYLRNVLISGNMIAETRIGIAVSVVDGAGAVTIGPNHLATTKARMVGMAWRNIVEPDLEANAPRYGHVTLGGAL